MPVSKQFITAGDATFTIDAPDDKHRTYRVRYVEGNNGFPPTYFVDTLAGPDNEHDYVYIGVLDPFLGQVRTTKKSKSWEGTKRLRLLNRVLARVWCDDHQAYQQFGYNTHHEGRCGKCGRKLTTPRSVESGIGPKCEKTLAFN